MPLRERLISLDPNGAGTCHVPPTWLAGHKSQLGPYGLAIAGAALDTGGTAMTAYSYGSEKLVGGSITIAGAPNDAVTFWYDFQ